MVGCSIMTFLSGTRDLGSRRARLDHRQVGSAGHLRVAGEKILLEIRDSIAVGIVGPPGQHVAGVEHQALPRLEGQMGKRNVDHRPAEVLHLGQGRPPRHRQGY
jgi:hypothetical protein